MGFRSLLITYNYRLVLSRNLYIDNYTTDSGLRYNCETADSACRKIKFDVWSGSVTRVFLNADVRR